MTGTILGFIPISSVIMIICFIPAIVVHEVAHGFVANLLGDPTAKKAGRLSLNPIKHIDPFGTVILPIGLALLGAPVFGYAKPVPYNPRYFKNIKTGELLTGLAGPASNLLLAGIATIIAPFIVNAIPSYSVALFWLQFFYFFIYINLLLMFFNLLPIPPLDGSSIIIFFLPREAIPAYYNFQRYALPIFFALVFVLPYILPFSPLSLYLQATAGNLLNVFTSWW